MLRPRPKRGASLFNPSLDGNTGANPSPERERGRGEGAGRRIEGSAGSAAIAALSEGRGRLAEGERVRGAP
jgi:hypothetical protein